MEDGSFTLAPPGVEAILHHAPPACHPHADLCGRRVRAVLGLSVDPRRAGTPSGGCMRDEAEPPRLLEHMLNPPDEEPPILLSAVSFGSQARALPRQRHPTFNTAAAVERFVEAASKGAHLGESSGGPKRANRLRHRHRRKRQQSASRPGEAWRSMRLGGAFGRPLDLARVAAAHGSTHCDSRIRRLAAHMWIVPMVDQSGRWVPPVALALTPTLTLTLTFTLTLTLILTLTLTLTTLTLTLHLGASVHSRSTCPQMAIQPQAPLCIRPTQPEGW